MTTINKNFEIYLNRISHDLDLLLKIQHQERKVARLDFLGGIPSKFEH